jgi:hypothetical protein
MSEQFPPIRETNFRYEHGGVHFVLSVKQLADGQWDAWVCLQISESFVIGHGVGRFVEWDEAHEAGLARAKELIENVPNRDRQQLGA